MKLFPGLVFLVLGVALSALRAISEEERNLGSLMEQFSNRFFSLILGIQLVHILIMVQNDRVLSLGPRISGRRVSVETGSCHVHFPMRYPAHKG